MPNYTVEFYHRSAGTRQQRIVNAPNETRAVLDAQALFKAPENWAPIRIDVLNELEHEDEEHV